MTSRAEITKSFKMQIFKQKCIISQFEGNQSLSHHLNWAFIIWIEEKDREDQEKIESDLICPFSYQLQLQDSDFQALSVYFITF